MFERLKSLINGANIAGAAAAPKKTKTIDVLAKEVLQGKWGAGETRKKKLTAAGYNYNAVQKKVNELVIDKVAREVLKGKWGAGDTRKKKLKAAGYDYYAVQKRVNEIIKQGKTIIDKELDACKVQADWMKNYTYKWEGNPTVAKSKKYGTCVTYVACVLQRIGVLKSGESIWHDKNGKVDFSNNKMEILYLKGSLKSLKKQLKRGDIVMAGDKNSVQAGGNSHIFILNGTWDSNSNPYIWDNNSATRVKQGKSALHTYSGNNQVIAVVRLKTNSATKQGYQGKFPEYKLVKTNAEVISDAIKWAKWIASDNRFHYGHGKDAHHNGCFFCGTQKLKQNHGIKNPDYTYCCNPFVGAAWAHGGGDAQAYKMCHNCDSWDFGTGSGSYHTSSLFDKVSLNSLKPGDVLCSDNHVALYIGNGKVVQAGHEDDNKVNSNSWNTSINIDTWNGYKRAYRYNGKVNVERPLSHGEVSDRVALWQKYLDWYFNGQVGSAEGIFGDNTLKWTKKFQEQELGKGQGDGYVGQKTIDAAKKVKK